MRQFYYNKLRNNRIKAIALGLFVIITNGSSVYLYYLTVGKEEMKLFYVVIILFADMGLLYLLALISFGQIIEQMSDGQVATYYKFGNKKLKYKAFGRPTNVKLEQDVDRHYRLTVMTENGVTLVLDRYPTLREANQELEELRKRIE